MSTGLGVPKSIKCAQAHAAWIHGTGNALAAVIRAAWSGIVEQPEDECLWVDPRIAIHLRRPKQRWEGKGEGGRGSLCGLGVDLKNEARLDRLDRPLKRRKDLACEASIAVVFMTDVKPDKVAVHFPIQTMSDVVRAGSNKEPIVPKKWLVRNKLAEPAVAQSISCSNVMRR